MTEPEFTIARDRRTEDGRLLPDDTARVAGTLKAGGVVLLPTDTVYGLAVHPERDDAAVRLFAMKRRPRTRNLPIMVASVEQIASLGVDITPQAHRLLAAFSPGALTLALGVRPGAAPAWLDGRVEVGVRVPDDKDLIGVLEATGPLLVTSANGHLQETPETVAEVLQQLDGRPDMVIDGGPRPLVPSTLVNCNLPTPVIERQGVIAGDDIERVLR